MFLDFLLNLDQVRSHSPKYCKQYSKESLNKFRKLRQWHFLTIAQYAMTQPSSFADLDHSHKKRRTHREAFLSEMEGVIPWQVLLLHIEPHYPKSRRWGRQPMAALEQFRIYCLQNWFSLSGRQMEDALYEIESMRSFAGFGGVTGALPDERPRY